MRIGLVTFSLYNSAPFCCLRQNENQDSIRVCVSWIAILTAHTNACWLKSSGNSFSVDTMEELGNRRLLCPCYSPPSQCFSNFNMSTNHLVMLWKMQILIQYTWGKAWESACLPISQVTPGDSLSQRLSPLHICIPNSMRCSVYHRCSQMVC